MRYTKEQIEFLVKNVYGRSCRELLELFFERFGIKLSYAQLRNFIGNRKLKTGLDTRFKKGNVPFNKGKKGVGGWKPTQFKKGYKPHNYKSIGSERVNVDGYVEVKVADSNKWKSKHIVVWENHSGAVPKGHAVIFADGDKRNININNLILVSRRQLLYLNRYKLIQNSAQLTKIGIMIADLMIKATEKQKEGK